MLTKDICPIKSILFDSAQKEHEIEEYLRKKYADDGAAAKHFGDGGEEMSDEITQQTLLPGVKLVLRMFVSGILLTSDLQRP